MRLLLALVLAAAGLAGVPAAAPAGTVAEPAIVYVTATEDSLVASIGSATPGAVEFSVGGNGTVVLLQLKGTYTLDKLYADFAKAFRGRSAPIRRMNKGATFYGGVFAGETTNTLFGGVLETGLYYLADLGNRNSATFEVSGTPEARAMPEAPTVRYTKRGIAMPRTMAPAGWMDLRNQTREVALIDMVVVKPGTTMRQIRAYFASGGHKYANRFRGRQDGSLILSPGEEYWWSYALRKGRAVGASFWPRQKDAEPQAFHGMWGTTKLK